MDSIGATSHENELVISDENDNQSETLIHIEKEDKENIDYILVRSHTENIDEEIKIYEQNLVLVGLQLKYVRDKETIFIKITVNDEVLKRFSAAMGIRMPLKEVQDTTNSSKNNFKKLYEWCKQFCICRPLLSKNTKEFSERNEHLFNTTDANFYTLSVRSMILNFILKTTKFTPEESSESKDNVGIYKLLSKKKYLTAYAVHEETKRKELLKNWAAIRNITKLQPLDDIQDYLGTKIALYFVWVKFYTHMLKIAALVGVLYMLHGIITYIFYAYKFEACNADYIMCPQCDNYCDYWEIKQSCRYSIITYVFDNSCTVIFTIFMTLWSAVYLRMWKRFSIEIVQHWSMTKDPLMDQIADNSFKKNMKHIQKIVISFFIVLLWIAIVVAFFLALMCYRLTLTTSEHLFGENSTKTKLFVTVTGSLLDFVSILILNYFFEKVAIWLTNKEKPRTQTDFENSLAWKIYLFWFVNYYSALFYIAFIKGRFIGYPGAYQKLFGYRQEECGSGGCMLELFIQLVVLMVGDITVNNVLEYLVPYVQRKWKPQKDIKAVLDDVPQYQKDYHLLEWRTIDMLYEYLEMVLQYGFVTLFVTAFPLAPLFALIHNNLEIRWDAKKLLTNYRRPNAENATDIGMWLWIMDFISKCAILSNACIIAFTSNFIPQAVYTLFINPNKTSAGFLDYSLSTFDVQRFENNTTPNTSKFNVTQCRYPDYRNPPGHEKEYERTMFFWYVLFARVFFIVLFQNLIVTLKMIVKWFLPEMPLTLKKHILEETEKMQKALMQQQRTHNQSITDCANI